MAHLDRVMIAGGGTGGHVYPGVAVAEEIQRRNQAALVIFVGTDRGMENRILPKLGLTLETITASRIKGGGVFARIKGIFGVPVGMWQAWRLMRRHDPQVVLGVGGYASGAVLLAAWLTLRRTAIQEQNAAPGLTNRVLGKFVRAVYAGFEAANTHFAQKKFVVTGNPLRRAVSDSLRNAEARTGGDVAVLRVLVFGGSQGARFLNENVPAAIAAFRAAHPALALTVTHQTGPADEETTRQRYADLALAEIATVTPYIDDMPAAYTASDVAITRAGALTLAELTAVGLPSLLVPFPFAADDHQAKNGQALVDVGAAKMVRQEAWSAQDAAAWLGEVADDRGRLTAMSKAARQIARLDAAATLVDHLEGIAK